MIGLGNEENTHDVRGELPAVPRRHQGRSTRTSRSSRTPGPDDHGRALRRPSGTSTARRTSTSSTSTTTTTRPGSWRTTTATTPTTATARRSSSASTPRGATRGQRAGRGLVHDGPGAQRRRRRAGVVRAAARQRVERAVVAGHDLVRTTSPGAPRNYEVQKLFTNNVGDQVVPSTGQPGRHRAADRRRSACPPGRTSGPVRRREGDRRRTAARCSATTSPAPPRPGPADRLLVRRRTAPTSSPSTTAQNTMVTAGSADWSNYTLSSKATKLAGAEGFLVAFGRQGHRQLLLVEPRRLEQHAVRVEKAVNGGKTNVIEKNTVIQTGHEYDIRIEVTGRAAKLYLDGVLWGTVDDTTGRSRLSVVTQGRQVRRHHRQGGQHHRQRPRWTSRWRARRASVPRPR